ncbi:hypothetical protein AB0K48_49275 [Nonomuraea sp. NPDC055795]
MAAEFAASTAEELLEQAREHFRLREVDFYTELGRPLTPASSSPQLMNTGVVSPLLFRN